MMRRLLAWLEQWGQTQVVREGEQWLARQIGGGRGPS